MRLVKKNYICEAYICLMQKSKIAITEDVRNKLKEMIDADDRSYCQVIESLLDDRIEKETIENLNAIKDENGCDTLSETIEKMIDELLVYYTKYGELKA